MLKKIWHDPVWSKVIASVIFVAGAAGATYFLNWWPSIIRAGTAAWRLPWHKNPVSNWLLALLALLALPTIIRAVRFVGSWSARDGLGGWRDYTSDHFFGLRWRWNYLNDHGTPLGLASFGPHCDSCHRELGTFDDSPLSLENRVERSIQQKLRNGTWAVRRAQGTHQR